ncbi:MAG: hypothetical protein K2X81_14380 [Candidatus Obscuribacterales bacterium]|nr:hypothetical protein [Candidatus Obscuribacterales bacterium]
MTTDFTRKWKQPLSSLLDRLDVALSWVALEHGRAATYRTLLVEYYEGQRSNAHFFAYFQAMEILSVYDAWVQEAEYFPGLKDKLSFVFKKGTILSEDEGINSNRPRNDGFVYILAGKLLHGSRAPILSVDGFRNTKLSTIRAGEVFTSDIVFLDHEEVIRIECKRPMTQETLDENVARAFEQITRSGEGSSGIIAVDISKLIQQPGHYLDASTLDGGANYVTDQIENLLKPLAGQYPQPTLIGMFGYASLPLVSNAQSMILDSHGKPFESDGFRTAAVGWLAIQNNKSPKGQLVHELQRGFGRSTHDIPTNAVPIR